MSPQDLLQHLDDGTCWPEAARATLPPDVPGAYRLALAVRAHRIRRGEQPAGFKIGFTNRTIWPRYQVFAPIWGSVWSTTLSWADQGGRVSLAGTCQPRLEPEIVFGLRATPPAACTHDELLDCLAWLAPGFEVVQTHCPDWRFTAAETVADSGLHARLHVGPRTPLAGAAEAALVARLADARVALWCGDRQVDSGCGAQVLDGPLLALHHFVRELQACPAAPALRAGDVVTTGTWTDAWPVQPGQAWAMRFDDGRAGLEITFD